MAQNFDVAEIYLGHFADIDTFEGNYAAEKSAALLETYGSPGAPLFQDIVTIDTDSPTQFIDADHDTGNGTLTYDVGGGTTSVGLDSLATFDADVTFTYVTTVNLELDAIQTTNGDVLVGVAQ
jgi:hypothetical protein